MASNNVRDGGEPRVSAAAKTPRPRPKPKSRLQAPIVYGPEPLMVKPLEAARLIGVGKNVLYRLLARGSIRTIKLGHSRLVPVAELRAWIARELEEQQGGAA